MLPYPKILRIVVNTLHHFGILAPSVTRSRIFARSTAPAAMSHPCIAPRAFALPQAPQPENQPEQSFQQPKVPNQNGAIRLTSTPENSLTIRKERIILEPPK